MQSDGRGGIKYLCIPLRTTRLGGEKFSAISRALKSVLFQLCLIFKLSADFGGDQKSPKDTSRLPPVPILNFEYRSEYFIAKNKQKRLGKGNRRVWVLDFEKLAQNAVVQSFLEVEAVAEKEV